MSPPAPRDAAGRLAPVPPLRAPTRFSWLGIALLGGAAVIAFVVTVGIFLPALGELGRMGQDPASLPRQLTVCDRTWDRGPDVTRPDGGGGLRSRRPRAHRRHGVGPRGLSHRGLRRRAGRTRDVPRVIYVQKGEDEYVRYELVADQ